MSGGPAVVERFERWSAGRGVPAGMSAEEWALGRLAAQTLIAECDGQLPMADDQWPAVVDAAAASSGRPRELLRRGLALLRAFVRAQQAEPSDPPASEEPRAQLDRDQLEVALEEHGIEAAERAEVGRRAVEAWRSGAAGSAVEAVEVGWAAWRLERARTGGEGDYPRGRGAWVASAVSVPSTADTDRCGHPEGLALPWGSVSATEWFDPAVHPAQGFLDGLWLDQHGRQQTDDGDDGVVEFSGAALVRAVTPHRRPGSSAMVRELLRQLVEIEISLELDPGYAPRPREHPMFIPAGATLYEGLRLLVVVDGEDRWLSPRELLLREDGAALRRRLGSRGATVRLEVPAWRRRWLRRPVQLEAGGGRGRPNVFFGSLDAMACASSGVRKALLWLVTKREEEPRPAGSPAAKLLQSGSRYKVFEHGPKVCNVLGIADSDPARRRDLVELALVRAAEPDLDAGPLVEWQMTKTVGRPGAARARRRVSVFGFAWKPHPTAARALAPVLAGGARCRSAPARAFALGRGLRERVIRRVWDVLGQLLAPSDQASAAMAGPQLALGDQALAGSVSARGPPVADDALVAELGHR